MVDVYKSAGVVKGALSAAHAPVFFTEDAAAERPVTRTTSPVTTNGFCAAVTYKDGVLVVTDTAANYGGWARYSNVPWVRRIGQRAGFDGVLIAATGDYSDFQVLCRQLEERATVDFVENDGGRLTAEELHSWVTRTFYNSARKADPLWLTVIVAGVADDGSPFLGVADMNGLAWHGQHAATGYAHMFGAELFRTRHRPDMSRDEAKALLDDLSRAVLYRYKPVANSFQFGEVTRDGRATVHESTSLATDWTAGSAPSGSGGVEGTW